MIEIERTFLVKFLPKSLEKCKSKEVFDIYIPKTAKRPSLRIRQNGKKFEITKKQQFAESDSTNHNEHSIPLTREEFKELSKLDGKKFRKKRYYYPYEGKTVEIDIYQDKLEGLVLAEFEFKTIAEKNSFKKPYFCIVDITAEKNRKNGILSAKNQTFKEISTKLKKHGYKRIKPT